MRKNKLVILTCLILVVAMVMAMAAGCSKTGDRDYTMGGNQDAQTIVIDKADRGIVFTVVASSDVDSIDNLVSVVKSSTGEKVNVEIAKDKEGKNVFKVNPPIGYYTMGEFYKITIDDSLTFSGYDSKVKSIVFNVNQDSLKDISMVDGLITFDSNRVINKSEEFGTRNNSAEQEVYGVLNLQTNGASVNAGDVILIKDENSSLVEAYKVENASPSSTTSMFINYVKPEINEVYDSFKVAETQEMDKDSNVEFTYDETQEALENSELAMAAVEFFGAAPTFDVNASKQEDGSIKATITMTIPDVVKVDGGSLDLIVRINAIMTAEANVNVDMEGNAVDCGVIAYVYNTIDTEVAIEGGYGYSSVTNLTDLIEKTVAMQESTNEDGGVAVPLFTWVLPIANGAVSVRYQADLKFNFNFSGKLGVNANAEFNYMVGATYDKEIGVTTYAEELDGSGLQEVTIDIEGSAKVKVGLRNGLYLDILAGVASLGIEAELGNFNGLYGFATTDNLVGVENIEDVAISGAIYFEGGFYYDVDLAVALSIGSIANIKKNIDIVAGEEVLYSAGEKTVVTDVEGMDIKLSATETELPAFNATAYDLKAMSDVATQVYMTDFEYADPNGYFAIANGVVTILKDSPFNARVNMQYPTDLGALDVEVNLSYDGSVVMDKADFDYDKAGENNTKDIVVKLIGGSVVAGLTSADQVTVDAKDAKFDLASKTITIPYKTVASMANGKNIINVNIAGVDAYFNINVSGVASITGFQKGNVYEVFSAEQILDMVAKSNGGSNFSGKTLKLVNNIDMNGATMAPVALFAGILDGNGMIISNYTISGVANNGSAFIAVNTGIVKNLTLAGNVNTEVNAKTANNYYVAGAVAINNGSVSGVNVIGNITMKSTSLNAFIEISVMGIVGSGNQAENSTQDVTINAISQFDIANVTIKVDSSAKEYTCSCENAAVSDGALVKFEVV